jgi:cell division protein FtsQ
MKIMTRILIIISALYLVLMPVYLTRRINAMLCGGININIVDSTVHHFITKREIRNLITENKTRVLGRPIKDISLSEIETRIAGLKELKDAEVYTTIDGTLHVLVDQRDPIMRVIVSSGDFYVDREGVVIRSKGIYTPRLHIIEGNIKITSQMLNGVSVLDTSIKGSILKDIFELVNYINDDSFWSAQIDQINVDNNNKIDLIPRLGNNLIHLGTIENYEGKLRNLEAFYKKVLPEAGWNKYDLINLEYKDQIVCRKRK